jgi:hypothetical protein
MLRASREHLAAVGESYFEHMRFALTVGILATGAGFACLIHALVPGICQQTCSRTLGLLQELLADRGRLRAVASQSSGVTIFVVLIAISSMTAVVLACWVDEMPMRLLIIAQAYALPAIFLSQNSGLDPLVRTAHA